MYTGQVRLNDDKDTDGTTTNPDGNGTLRLDDGAVYDGEWRDGKPHGTGVYATIDGDLHHCQTWSNGLKHGSTVDVWADGRVYRGTYCQGQRQGQGVLTWPYGASYTGHFEHDKRNGSGRYVYADGRCYEGNYRDDRPHGYGVLTTAEGVVIYDGMWELGEFVGGGGGQTTATK